MRASLFTDHRRIILFFTCLIFAVGLDREIFLTAKFSRSAVATGIRVGSLFFLVLEHVNSSTPVRYLTAIQPGSQNTHCMQHGQQCCHCYISQKWPTCIMTSLCKSAIASGLGTSIHGVVVFLGSFYSGNVVIGRFIYGVVVISGSLYS